MKYHTKKIIGDCTLYHGDCMDILPKLGDVDAVVTDPPYGIGGIMKGGAKTGHWKALSQGNKWDYDAKQEWIDFLLQLDVASIVWGGHYFLVPPSRCWLIWRKVNAVPTMADCEMAWTNFECPAKIFNGLVGKNEYGHPTQKPLALMRWCLSLLPVTAQTILDPFMGSGTTGVACAKMGRKFIGIELDKEYFDIACKRIEEAYSQPDMFVEQPKEMKQESLLDG